MALGPILTELLKRYGLTSLTNWASQAIIGGLSPEEIELQLRDRPEFKSRFAGMFTLEALGQPPISVDEYLAYETTAHALAAMWGVHLNKDEVDGLIGGQVSNVELQKRFDLAAEALYESPPETIAELQRMGGANPGQLIKFFMDPKKELGVMQSQFRQATLAGIALRTGYGQLTQLQAQRLADVGLTREGAQEGFGQLVEMRELFDPIDVTEEKITQESQVEFLAGDIEAGLDIQKRQRKRIAEFEGSSGFASGREGFAVGTAE